MTRILAWNLNHRSRPTRIPAGVIDAIRQLHPDILVLNEYVQGTDHRRLWDDLRSMGLGFIKVSEKRPGHNQVLMASKFDFIVGTVPAPSIQCDSHGRTNFLAASFHAPDFTLIGMRAPAYESAKQVRAYWGELTETLKTIAPGKVVVIGDMNGDPDDGKSIGGQYLDSLRAEGWKIPRAVGDWSYKADSGAYTSRIDHVVASPGIRRASASYITALPGIVVAGTRAEAALSDHAICVAEVDFGV